MKRLMILLLMPFLALLANSQSPRKSYIKGRIQDKETKEWLANATITCLKASDSTKMSITFSDKSGTFVIDSPPSCELILYITFLGYTPLSYSVTITTGSEATDIGIIRMEHSGLTLTPVEIVKSKIKLRMTKDTLEYSSDVFNLQKNALVSDLLKKIPGIQIGTDGIIRFNNEIVETIMINGHSLLGIDNKSIAENLQADMIDKIQLVDRRPDQRNPQKYNGGETDKIINITIKKNKEKIFSGELTAAYGTKKKHITKFNLSRFYKREQLLIFGNADNINGGSISGAGIQSNSSAGINYTNFISRKINITFGASFSQSSNLDQYTSTKENIIGDSILKYSQNVNNKIKANNTGFNVQIEYQIDSLQKISILSQVTSANNRNHLMNSYETIQNDSVQVNSGNLNNETKSSSLSTYNNIRYEKKFNKPRRSLDISASYTNGNGNTSAYIISGNKYSPLIGETTADTINQYSNKNEKTQQIFLLISYTEPINKYANIMISYGQDHLKEYTKRDVMNYNKSTNHYDLINDSLSTSFKNNPNQHYANLAWRYRKNNLDYSLSISTLLYHLNAEENVALNHINRDFATLLPGVSLNWSLTPTKRVRFSYRKRTFFPQSDQLQAISDYADAIYIKQGNPSLRPGNEHNLDLGFSIFNDLSLRNLSVIVKSKILTNEIIYSNRFDSLGRQLSLPINLNGSFLLNARIESNLPLKGEINAIYIITSMAMRKSMNDINGIIGYNKNLSLSQSIKLSYTYKKIFDLICSANIDYNNVQYTSESGTNSKFINGALNITGNINLPLDLNIGTTFNANWLTGRNTGYNATPLLLNASISKLIFSHKQGLIQFQLFDLLKQNTSITRNIGVNYIEDIKSNTLGQFFLLKLSYFLGKGNN